MILNKTANRDFSLSVFMRMIYSCLVDADFLDTEAFMKNGKGKRDSGQDIAVLLEKLENHIFDWLQNRDMPTVNGRRTEILRHCLEMGESEKGLFRLTVPTGGGKTIASLAFALRHAVKNKMDRVIYVIPYTSIIDTMPKCSEIFWEKKMCWKTIVMSIMKVPKNLCQCSLQLKIGTNRLLLPRMYSFLNLCFQINLLDVENYIILQTVF